MPAQENRNTKPRQMFAIVDCNSFYCSCERVFRPDIWHRPVVVLSNNDGCIVSRTDEAKALGVGMAVPYFQSKPVIEQHGIATFSSNYNLYGDMSRRVMDTLRHIAGEENVEVYSVDEAFINLTGFTNFNLAEFALHLRHTVEQWTGIAVSVGIAPTKVLSKVANRLSKKNKQQSNCVMVLETDEQINDALCKTMVDDIWGIGRQYAQKLHSLGIHDAYQLKQMPAEWAEKRLGGVVGLRLLKELKGEATIDLKDPLETKKMIATTRMFGTPVKTLNEIKEAVATYTSRAAEKLRRQSGAASVITVFLVPKEETKPGERFRHGPMQSKSFTLPNPTSITNDLIKPASELAAQLFKEGNLYKKAGVMLSGIVPDKNIQANLFAPASKNNARMLMSMMDNINFSMRNDIIKFAASGMEKNWKMRQELRSPYYTTRWDELREVR